MSNNPLLKTDGVPAFDKIEASHVQSAIETVLKESEEALKEVESQQTYDWKSIIEPLDLIGKKLHAAWGPVNHLLHTKNSEDLRSVHEKVLPEVVSFSLRFSQSEKLLDAYKKIRDSQSWSDFSSAQKRIIEKNIVDAELSGINLHDDKKERFNEISKELSNLSTTFSNNVLDSTKAFELILTTPDEIEGLQESFLGLTSQSYNQSRDGDAANSTAEKGPWRISLDIPIYVPFMQHSKSSDLRKKMYFEFIQRASSGKLDNTDNILKILSLRQEKAELLGYKNFAELSLAKKMAPNIEAVNKLQEDLRLACWEFSTKEHADLQTYAKKNGHEGNLQHWDFSFWAERQREELFQYTEEELKPYFPLPNVLDGLFQLVKRIFEIDVRAADGEVPVWHKDVRYFKIYDKSGAQIAAFFLDPFSRPENKRGGAWMDDCLGRGYYNGELQLPVAYLICNSAPPVGDKPSLMGFRDVETLFHEFGHGLQHMLTRVDFPEVAGINGIEWDAVELPSQFMENWCYHKPTLLGLAKHYETNETLPEELFEKLKKSRNYLAATQMLRQLRFGMTDIELHSNFKPTSPKSLFDLAQEMGKKTSVKPPLEEDRMLCSFAHIFAGGYAAGYYSYKWAEVLSADAFAAFEEVGLDNESGIQETGLKFRETVLAQGGSVHPMEVFKAFRGREPSTEALLRHSGLK